MCEQGCKTNVHKGIPATLCLTFLCPAERAERRDPTLRQRAADWLPARGQVGQAGDGASHQAAGGVPGLRRRPAGPRHTDRRLPQPAKGKQRRARPPWARPPGRTIPRAEL